MTHVKTILAALSVTTAAALMPVTASAQSYDYLDCKKSDKDAQVVGSIVGGLIGAVAGHEIAGRGETTEGAVIGGLIGAAAGAGVGDDRRNCTREERALNGDVRTLDTVVYSDELAGGLLHDASHHGRRGHARRGDNRDSYGGYRSARDVRYRIEVLKDEDRRLKRRQKFERAYWIDRRRDEIRFEVKRLKRIEDRLKDRRDYRRDDYRRDYRRDYREPYYGDRRFDRNRRGSRHYHGSNVCYSRH